MRAEPPGNAFMDFAGRKPLERGKYGVLAGNLSRIKTLMRLKGAASGICG
jgi:hypothetical protein